MPYFVDDYPLLEALSRHQPVGGPADQQSNSNTHHDGLLCFGTVNTPGVCRDAGAFKNIRTQWPISVWLGRRNLPWTLRINGLYITW
jgi:hypothetical protein